MKINNIDQLRDYLSEQLTGLSKEEIKPVVANAAANIAEKILKTIKLEIEYNTMVGAVPDIEFLNGQAKHALLDSNKKNIFKKVSHKKGKK